MFFFISSLLSMTIQFIRMNKGGEGGGDMRGKIKNDGKESASLAIS